MNNIIESHPFEPFLPEGAKILMLGTFPPAEHRWCMPFYYPNFQNDMWRIMGILFFDDKDLDIPRRVFYRPNIHIYTPCEADSRRCCRLQTKGALGESPLLLYALLSII